MIQQPQQQLVAAAAANDNCNLSTDEVVLNSYKFESKTLNS